MTRTTVMRLSSLVLVAAAALAGTAWVTRASSVVPVSLPCGHWTIAQQGTAFPTPMVAPTPADSPTSAPRVVAIGAWSTCFRPAVVTIETGEIIQWQQADAGTYHVALDGATTFGPIRHVLEVRFNRPGTYGYHGNQSGDVKGTIIVTGTPRPGPAFETR